MNSENISSNTSDNEELQSGPKKAGRIRVIIGVSILVVIGIIVSILIVNKNIMENKRNEYEVFCNSYNENVDIYNAVANKYNALLAVVSKESNIEKASSLAYYEENFERYYNEGAERAILDAELNVLLEDVVEITNTYNALCISSYNDVVKDYNAIADNYNSLIERLTSYTIPNMPGKEELKIPITEEYDIYYEKWIDVTVISNDIKGIEEDIDTLNAKYYEACLLAYNSVIGDYNIMAEAYNAILVETSTHFIEGMQGSVALKETYNDISELTLEEEELCSFLDDVMAETDALIVDYLITKQITNPTEEWVLDRLESVESITGMQAVTEIDDPNGLLGKEGGYTSCVYFTVSDIEANSVKGNSIVEKGTDAGGAIEVYSTLEYALNRCDYLSQFDGTLLYSGSYAVIGTMVVRTSYQLSNSEQVALTNEITKAFTLLK